MNSKISTSRIHRSNRMLYRNPKMSIGFISNYLILQKAFFVLMHGFNHKIVGGRGGKLPPPPLISPPGLAA